MAREKKKLDSLRGEFISPRVKPGMTKQQKAKLVHYSTFIKDTCNSIAIFLALSAVGNDFNFGRR